MKLSESDLSFAWQCPSCGCYFPHIPKVLDDDVKRCSKCVEVEILEQRVEEVESERDMLRTVLDDTDKAELLEALEQSTKEALTLRERVEGLERALKMTMKANPECPLCHNGMEHSPSKDDWWRLNHKDTCAWLEALAEEEA